MQKETDHSAPSNYIAYRRYVESCVVPRVAEVVPGILSGIRDIEDHERTSAFPNRPGAEIPVPYEIHGSQITPRLLFPKLSPVVAQ